MGCAGGSEKPAVVIAPWRWVSLAVRVAQLWRAGEFATPALLCRSYDAAAADYDEAWTGGMREFTGRMLGRLDLHAGDRCLDLTCGTGYVTAWLLSGGGSQVTGVDASARMLCVARRNYPSCAFVRADILDFLRAAANESLDVITCAWGLGYSRPRAVIGEIARVLRPGGRVGIIDNSLWSLREMVWASVRTFALAPQSLEHVLRVRFLTSSRRLRRLLQAAGLSTVWREDGQRTFLMGSGEAAIGRLRRTGAAAGFEFAASAPQQERVYRWFAQELERRWGSRIPVTHRYLAAVARKDP